MGETEGRPLGGVGGGWEDEGAVGRSGAESCSARIAESLGGEEEEAVEMGGRGGRGC